MPEFLFWFSLFILFYTYLGYGILTFIIVHIKRIFISPKNHLFGSDDDLPTVTLLVAAYNEEDCIDSKIRNSLNLDYPKDKLSFLFVTDGSTDRTREIISNYPEITILHQDQRKGKVVAVNRAMKYVSSDLTVFSDANAILNKQSVRNMARHFLDSKVGVVAAEKRIIVEEKDDASSTGEGIYWRYESTLKRWDTEINSTIGAAGELFSIRTGLYREIQEDTIIEDFYLTMLIAKEGYKIAYEPNAFAIESSSLSVKEELKRKVRICAGGIQAIIRLRSLLNPFRFGILSFQYVSHRVLRWTIAPWALIPLIIFNYLLVILNGEVVYITLFLLQTLFYFTALAGYFMENHHLKNKWLFIPYYFLMMNWSALAGAIKYLRGRQSVKWERASRKALTIQP